MILIVSSRRPAQRTRSLIKDLNHVIPHSARMNRGKKSIKDLQRIAVGMGYDRIMLISSKGGKPSTIRFIKVYPDGFEYLEGEIRILNVVLRREISNRRAPPMTSLCIFNVTNERECQLAKYLREGLNTEAFIDVNSINSIQQYGDEYDCALLLKAIKEGFIIDFYHVHPFYELGPRLEVSFIGE